MNGPVIIFPKVAKPVTAPRIKYLHDALTGFVITSRHVSLLSPFDGSWLIEAVASHFDVSPDQVECIETDEHPDGLAINGELVAFVEVN